MFFVEIRFFSFKNLNDHLFLSIKFTKLLFYLNFIQKNFLKKYYCTFIGRIKLTNSNSFPFKMSSKERISTRADSKDKKKFISKTETKLKSFQIYYNEEKLMTVQMELTKKVKDLDKILKNKLKDRFYNYMGLQSIREFQVLDYSLLNKNFSLSEFQQHQKFRILLEGQVYDLYNPTLNDFIFLKCIGKGASSVVYLVRHRQNCKIYALKQVPKTYITDFKKMEFLLRQKKILTQIVNKAPFASRIYATFQSKNHLNFLLKYYPGGQIFYHLQDHRMKEIQIKLYFCQILLAIQNLHKQKIIFRDLKPQNILIDLNGNAVLSDFGLCKVNVKKQQLTVSFCGSDIYMPPQVKDKVGYNYHADFYTLGAFLYQMATGLPPYYNNHSLNFSSGASTQMIQLCLQLLESDLKKRLCDFVKIKRSKWFENIDWEKVKSKNYQMPIKLNLYKSYIHEDFNQPLTFKQVSQPIFDRLFDFFFYISDNENGISKCYLGKQSKIKQSVSEISKKEKITMLKKEKSKDRSKSHKNSVQKIQKLLQKQPQRNKNKETSKKKQQKTVFNHQTLKQQKSKSTKKRSTQNSPCLHNLHKQKEVKRQKNIKMQKQLNQIQKQQFNIYQKNIRRHKKIDMKSVKSGSLTVSSLKSLHINTVINSPTAKRKNI